MKIRKYVVPILACVMLLTGVMAFKVNAAGFITEDIDAETKERILSNTELQITYTQPPKDGIECFDVNEYEWVALGFSDMNQKTVSIYDADFIFQYAITFQDSGNYGVGWSGENLLIYSVRGNYSLEIHPDGEIADIKAIPTTKENNCYWNDVVYGTEREVNGARYEVGNDMGILNVFANAHSQLYKTDSAGNRMLLFSANRMQSQTVLTWMIIIITFIGVWMLLFISQIRRSRRKTENGFEA